MIDKTLVLVSNTGLLSISPNDISNAKPLTLGNALIDIFSRKITPKNFEDAADMKKWHSRFYNKLSTEKGVIELDSGELKKIKEILDTKADPTKLEIVIDGAVYEIMTDYLAKALIKK